ncbi:MAG: FHA domain-containing protein, partial [Planctomycetes bacterium]|nr:FHA domain-containing protein [Planctomycetota bacterium]
MNKKAKLKLSIQDQQGLREFSLDGNGPWTIGRGEDAEVTLQEKRSSRRHARITAESGTLLIEDLKSTNGTLLNGKPLTEKTRLRSDSVIAIGESRIQIVKPAEKVMPKEAETPDRKPSSRGASSTRPSRNKSRRKESSPAGTLLLIVGALLATGWLLSTQMGGDSGQETTEVSSLTPSTEENVPAQVMGDSELSIPTLQPLDDLTQTQPASAVNLEEDSFSVPARGNSFDADSRFDVDLDQFHDAADSETPVSDAKIISPETESRGALELLILDEAWPPSERIIAYEFH